MRNQLAVAVANIEAFIDGKIEPTTARLNAVLQALGELDVLMNDLSRLRVAEELRSAREPADAAPVPSGMPTTMQRIDVCALVLNEATVMEATAQAKGVRFSVHQCTVPDPACTSFVGDPARIGQILKNVLLNAIRYTPAGGSVEVNCVRRDGSLVLTVDDGGPGVSDAEVSRIFEHGFRGSASGSSPGSGIGLALVKSFVEQQGGSISVGRSPQGGAEFVVALPGVAAIGDGGCLACGVTVVN
jgi:signal transduction histidine kinase